MKEITFQGTLDPNTPIAQGWLRASHRKLVPELSTEWKPYQAHDEKQYLNPGEIYELDIEVWPTCIVAPPGYRLALSVRGKDYEYSCATTHKLSNMKNVFRGCGPFLHDDPTDRPEEIFAKKRDAPLRHPNTPPASCCPWCLRSRGRIPTGEGAIASFRRPPHLREQTLLRRRAVDLKRVAGRRNLVGVATCATLLY